MNPTLHTTDISAMNVTRLKQELTRRGLPAHGFKLALAERLQQAMENPQLAQQLASTVMLDEMQRMLDAGDVESIRLYLDAGVDVGIATEEGGWNPLHIACGKAHVALVRLLLAEGADKGGKADNNGATPLFVACQEGHEEIARLLLGEGADSEKGNNNGATPPGLPEWP